MAENISSGTRSFALGSITRPRQDSPYLKLNESWSIANAKIEQALDTLLPRSGGLHGRVKAAMRYAVFAGGKRLRPFLTLQSARLFGVPTARALRAASAIEFIHTYSLIHDDLPCMDDDDLRRGRPATHVKFDEATAVLAGDGLIPLAFEVLAAPETHPSADVRSTLLMRLGGAIGADGLVGGQMIDMLAPGRAFDIEDVIILQRMKTGALFEFSCESGAILGCAAQHHRTRLREYARALGIAFQIADDLIDATGSAERAGKTVGKDYASGKATLVSLLGFDGARRKARLLAEHAVDVLSPFGSEAEFLRLLPKYLLDRDS